MLNVFTLNVKPGKYKRASNKGEINQTGYASIHQTLLHPFLCLAEYSQ